MRRRGRSRPALNCPTPKATSAPAPSGRPAWCCEEKDAVVVPAEAVHQLDGCSVVFVRDKDFLKEGAPSCFTSAKCGRAPSEDGRLTEIIVGLLPGEVVATHGSDVLQAQLMKDRAGRRRLKHFAYQPRAQASAESRASLALAAGSAFII